MNIERAKASEEGSEMETVSTDELCHCKIVAEGKGIPMTGTNGRASGKYRINGDYFSQGASRTIRSVIIYPCLLTLLVLGGCKSALGPNTPTPTGFTRYPNNPVYSTHTDSWNYAAIGDPCVIYDSDAGLYKMWTSGGGNDPNGTYHLATDVIVRIQYLTSPDGVTWTEAPSPTNPVLYESATGWDSGGAETPTVLKVGSTYYMWYGGYVFQTDANPRPNPPVGMQIGLATSPDGIT